MAPRPGGPRREASAQPAVAADGCAGRGRGATPRPEREPRRDDRPRGQGPRGRGRTGPSRPQGAVPSRAAARAPISSATAAPAGRVATIAAASASSSRHGPASRARARSGFALRQAGGPEGAARGPQDLRRARCGGRREDDRLGDLRQDRQRLDKWLWFARFAKTRAAASRLVEDGHVRVEGRRVESRAQALKPGDVLTLALPHATLVVTLLALGERRGPFERGASALRAADEGRRGDASLAAEDGDG